MPALLAERLTGEPFERHVRALTPETEKPMATSHLADSITDRSWLPSWGHVGFGIDFAVRLRPPANAAESHGAAMRS